MKHSKRRLAIIASTTAAVLLGGGIAAAYWTNTGSGTGSAKVGAPTANTVVIAQTSTIANLYPATLAQAQPITFTVTNNDTTSVGVSSVSVAVDPASVPPGCLVGDFQISSPAPLATPVNLAPGASAPSSAFGVYSIYLQNTTANQDACQNANLTLKYTSS